MLARHWRTKQRRLSRGRRGAGFSLIEVMVAVGVLGIAGIGSIALMSMIFTINKDSRKRSIATAVARETIDELFALTSVAHNSTAFDQAVAAAGYAVGATTAKTVQGIDVRVTIANEIGTTGMHPTWVQVEWMRGVNSHPAPVTFQTFLMRPK